MFVDAITLMEDELKARMSLAIKKKKKKNRDLWLEQTIPCFQPERIRHTICIILAIIIYTSKLQ